MLKGRIADIHNVCLYKEHHGYCETSRHIAVLWTILDAEKSNANISSMKLIVAIRHVHCLENIMFKDVTTMILYKAFYGNYGIRIYNNTNKSIMRGSILRTYTCMTHSRFEWYKRIFSTNGFTTHVYLGNMNSKLLRKNNRRQSFTKPFFIFYYIFPRLMNWFLF